MSNQKLILDACCGSKMMWFDKSNVDVIFGDIRDESHVLCDGRPLEIKPDMIIDFRDLPFTDCTFQLVCLDPPHMKKLGKSSWLYKKYGALTSTWQSDIKRGVNECMRVLKPGGVLIFKWNEHQVSLSEVLKLIDYTPLFGHTSGKHGKTIWLCFMKAI